MTLIILFAILSLFPSCKLDLSLPEREVYLITVGDDFYGLNGSERRLENVITDQAALVMQLSSEENVNLMAYISEKGKRYTSSSPRYIPLDKDGNPLPSPDTPSFASFSYSPQDGEEESGWTMNDVMEYIGSINADSNDLIIFTFSGHGESNNGALMTNASPSSRAWDSISPEDLLDRIATLSGKKLLILDSCYSGKYIASSPFTSADIFSTPEKEDRWEGVDYPSSFIKALSSSEKEKGNDDIWILASAGKGQEASDSLESGDGPFQTSYGAFTYFLLKGLGYDTERNMPSKKNERITLYSLYSYIRSMFPNYETQIQTPRITMRKKDLVLFD